MINLSVKYRTNEKAALLEQAAGFPPYTRGYTTINQNVEIEKVSETDFTLLDYTDSSIIGLFIQIKSQLKKERISLNIPFNEGTETITSIRALRTLLAFTSEKLYGNPAATKFKFYSTIADDSSFINILTFTNAAQLDVLMTDDLEKARAFSSLINPCPIDSFYGSPDLEENTCSTFFRLWKQIDSILP